MRGVKKSLFGALIFTYFVEFASAQFYRGYSRFSIRNFFDTMDSQTVILLTLFIIFFAIIFFALSRVFKDDMGQPNRAVAGTISLGVSFLLIYGLYRQGFDISRWFFRIGIPTDLFYSIMPILLLVAIIIAIWKFKFHVFLTFFGLFLMGISTTDIIYEKGLVGGLGLVLTIVGILLWSRNARKATAQFGKWGFKATGTWWERRQARKAREKELRRQQEAQRITDPRRLLPAGRDEKYYKK